MPADNSTVLGPRSKDRTGLRYGRFTVLRFSHWKNQAPHWVCQCDCGTVKTVAVNAFMGRKPATTSCGCYNQEQRSERALKHGCSLHGRVTPEYRAWQGIKNRCSGQKNWAWPYYGARGVQMCERWRSSFPAFLEDMGPRPSSQHSIDRIDNDGDYEPGNCRWATRVEQMRNTRRTRMLTFSGCTMCLKDWSRRLGISEQTLRDRLKKGWSIEAAFTTPPKGARL